MLSLTLTRVAVHGETDKQNAQKIWSEQKSRDFSVVGQQQSMDNVPDNLKEVPCDITAVYTNDTTKLEITIREWSQVGELKETITLSSIA
jgi:hypothetical protein